MSYYRLFNVNNKNNKKDVQPMKKVNFMLIRRIIVCSIFVFISSFWISKPVFADMYKYAKKDGSTLLTGKRLSSKKYRLIKVYKIKKKRAYKSSSSRKKKTKLKKARYSKSKTKSKRYSKKRKTRTSRKKRTKRYTKRNRNKKKSTRTVRKKKRNKYPKSLIKPNGRDNGIIVGCNSPKHLNRQSRIYQKPIQIYSQIYNVDAELIHAIVRQESCFNEGALSRVGAIGLMQLMPHTALGLRINDPWNPEHNIQGGIKYIAQMLKQFKGKPKLAIAAYNAGPGNVRKYKGIPPFAETKNYVKKVYGEYQRLKREGINYPTKKIQVALK